MSSFLSVSIFSLIHPITAPVLRIFLSSLVSGSLYTHYPIHSITNPLSFHCVSSSSSVIIINSIFAHLFPHPFLPLPPSIAFLFFISLYIFPHPFPRPDVARLVGQRSVHSYNFARLTSTRDVAPLCNASSFSFLGSFVSSDRYCHCRGGGDGPGGNGSRRHHRLPTCIDL